VGGPVLSQDVEVTDEAEALDETEDTPQLSDLELEGDIAADYVEGLLDIADLDGDIDMDVEGDRAIVSVVGATLDELVGDDGEVLEALQELTRLAVHRQTGLRARLMLDIGGDRAPPRADLADHRRNLAEEGGGEGEPKTPGGMLPGWPQRVHHGAGAGGLAGVILAWMAAVAVRNTTPVPMALPWSSVFLGVGLSAVVGLFFGIYPATRAAKLDPVVALRAE